MSIPLPDYDLLPYGLTPTQPTWTPLTTPPPTSPPAPVPVGGVLPPDGSVIMPGDSGERMELRVVRIVNPAPRFDPQNPSGPELEPRLGYRHILISVQVENTGDVPFMTDIEKYSWLVDKAGNTYARDVEMTEARQLYPATRLDAKSWVTREIVFEVKESAELTRFRLSTHPGEAGQTQDWRLS
ncbi:DUF4352 domain-containing protein [Paractinoplanes maris]|uniref:DUF4352 domain-containing protein n=1 Tax=Paractinoplanes maris TaxID=1734446 RepID=UPI00201FBE5C|nr:hypothetical protein [Actinoplanes maris]